MESAKSMPLSADKALIFRIVHRDNVQWILENGLHAANGKRDPKYRNIGNVDLIDKRSTRVIKVSPGGTLSDYIPFYFTPFSIMMYNIHTGYNVPQVSNDEIVILVSSLHRVKELGIPFVFTDQHAYPVMADYFTDLSDLKEVDWDLLNSRNFKHDPDDPGKKERYQAEALIWKYLPAEGLLGICCHTNEVAEQIQPAIDRRKLTITASVQKNWYF